MRRLLLVLAFIAILVWPTNSQNPQAPGCPTLSLEGPGIVMPGDIATFRVRITGADAKQLGYIWTVSQSEIVSGQGTDTLRVISPGASGVTASVKVSGLPNGCPDGVSETSSYTVDPGHSELYEYGRISWNEEAQRIAKLPTELAKNASSQIYIRFEASNKKDIKVIRQRARRILDLLRDRNVDTSRFTFDLDQGKKVTTSIYIIPAGAGYPPCAGKCSRLY